MTISNTELREAARHAIAAQKNMGVAPATILRLLDENEGPCEVAPASSRICERGTSACVTQHSRYLELLKAENAALVKERDHLMVAGAELLATVDSADDEIVVLKDDNARLLKRIESATHELRCLRYLEALRILERAADDAMTEGKS